MSLKSIYEKKCPADFKVKDLLMKKNLHCPAELTEKTGLKGSTGRIDLYVTAF